MQLTMDEGKQGKREDDKWEGHDNQHDRFFACQSHVIHLRPQTDTTTNNELVQSVLGILMLLSQLALPFSQPTTYRSEPPFLQICLQMSYNNTEQHSTVNWTLITEGYSTT